jgi:hypothetical protein
VRDVRQARPGFRLATRVSRGQSVHDRRLGRGAAGPVYRA